jgi:hypothetical protein
MLATISALESRIALDTTMKSLFGGYGFESFFLRTFCCFPFWVPILLASFVL